MICPYCKNVNSPKEVLRTWTVKNGSVKRKRRCSQCQSNFHTIEMVMVIKERILYNLKPKASETRRVTMG